MLKLREIETTTMRYITQVDNGVHPYLATSPGMISYKISLLMLKND
jgi:hypothetical protein